MGEQVSAPAPCDVRHLVESNLAFVYKVAGQYRNLGIPFEDLLNEGNLGLIQAAHRFDPGRGTKFGTYAVWWIRRAILKALTDQAKIVKVPEYQTRRIRQVREVETSLRLVLGRAPRQDEISGRVAGGVRAVRALETIPLREVSLNHVHHGSKISLADSLADRERPTPEERLLERESRILVRGALTDLTDRERVVLYHRFGLGGDPCLSLLETGVAMGISRERVRQIQDRAVERMRRALRRSRSIPGPRSIRAARAPA
jgi:RNA polymerase primary sigma factor